MTTGGSTGPTSNKTRFIDWTSLDRSEQIALLARYRAIVPRRDGRFLRADEIDGTGEEHDEMRHAATVLALGELEATVEGDPPTARVTWKQAEATIKAALAPFADDHASTGVDKPPADHVAEALAALHHLKDLERFYLNGVTGRNQRGRIHESIALAALAGFQVGQDAQLALRATLARTNASSATAREQAERTAQADRANLELADSILGILRAEVAKLHANADLGREKAKSVKKAKAEAWHAQALELRAKFNREYPDIPKNKASVAYWVAVELANKEGAR